MSCSTCARYLHELRMSYDVMSMISQKMQFYSLGKVPETIKVHVATHEDRIHCNFNEVFSAVSALMECRPDTRIGHADTATPCRRGVVSTPKLNFTKL
jgi:hypothetical protein